MKLKKESHLYEFMERVNCCRADVYFTTDEGDNLNLSSQLSQYIMAVISNDKELLVKGNIVCRDPADYDMLKDFLEE